MHKLSKKGIEELFERLIQSQNKLFIKTNQLSYLELKVNPEIEKLEDFSVLDESMSYDEFYNEFLIKNRPCLFVKNITNDWNSRRDWTNHEEVNFQSILNTFSETKINATKCQSPEENAEYGIEPTHEMTVEEYINYWKDYKDEGYPSTKPCFYLKDWHIKKSSKNGYCPYETPRFFADDWLNEACEEDDDDDDDYRFAYLGPKGSWSSFHSDVYGSFSWSANVVGRKKWRLHHPNSLRRFFDSKKKRLIYDYENPGRINYDFYEVIQEAGEAIFVPSGWYHVVWNLEDTISINHNWINATNLIFVWKSLQKAFDDVVEEIAEMRNDIEFDSQCQIVLKANYGINYSEFYKLLLKIRTKREVSLKNECNIYCKFDILIINYILSQMCDNVNSESEFQITYKS